MSSAYVSLLITHKYVTINRHGRYSDGSRISIQVSVQHISFLSQAADSRIYSGRRTLRLPSGVTTATGAPLLAVTVTVPALVRAAPAVVVVTVARAVTAARTVIAAAIVTATATGNGIVTVTATGNETVMKKIKTRTKTANQRERKTSVEAPLRKQRSGARTAIMRGPRRLL